MIFALVKKCTGLLPAQRVILQFHAIHGEDRAGVIILPMPALAVKIAPDFQRAIDFGIGERFIASIGPAQPCEQAEFFGQILLHI